MKAHGTKIKIGLSSSNRSDTAAGSLAKTRLANSTPLDTPCPTATIFELCKTTNDASFYKKRNPKTKAKKDGEGGEGKETGREGVVGGLTGNGESARTTAAAIKEKAAAASRASANANASGGGVAMGPQVEIVNGKIVLRESSLMVPVHGPVTHEDFEEVEEDIHPTAKYSSFTKHVHSNAWGIEETKQFYEAMRQCGTDFSMMQAFFPHRTRKQLKLKFTREEKQHPALVKATLTSQLPLDLAPFEVHLGSIMDADTTAKRASATSNDISDEKLKLAGIKRKLGREDHDHDDEDDVNEDGHHQRVDTSKRTATSKQSKASQHRLRERQKERVQDFSISAEGPLVDV